MDQISRYSLTPTTNLSDLCIQMLARGYNYATFMRKDDYFRRFNQGIISQEGNSGLKPMGIYFSKLIGYDTEKVSESGQTITKRKCKPAWYLYTKYQYEERLDDLKECDIIFAKFDTSKLFDFDTHYEKIFSTGLRKVSSGSVRDALDVRIKWHQAIMNNIFENYSGVIASKNTEFAPWDCPTICIWNNNCIKEHHCFAHTDSNFNYIFTAKPKEPMPRAIKIMFKHLIKDILKSNPSQRTHEMETILDDELLNDMKQMIYDIPEDWDEEVKDRKSVV